MPVQKQIVSVPINGKVDDKTDPKLGPFPGFSLLENESRKRSGELRKRYGYNQIALTSGNYGQADNPTVGALTQSSNHSLIDYEGSAALLSKATSTNDFYAYRRFNQNSSWNSYVESRFPKLVTTAYQSISQNSSYNVVHMDCAIIGNLLAIVYDRSNPGGGSGRIFAAFYDIAAEKILKSDILISNEIDDNKFPRVFANGTRFQFIWHDGGTLIRSRLFDPALGSFLSIFNLASDAAPSVFHDAIQFDGQVAYAYASTSSSLLKVARIDSAGNITLLQSFASGDIQTTNISLCTDGAVLFVVYHHFSVNQIKAYVLSTTLTTLFGPTTLFTGGSNVIQNITAEIVSSTLRVYYGLTNTVFEQRVNLTTTNSSLGSITTTVANWGATVTSKAVNLNNKAVFMIGGNLDQADSIKVGASFLTEELWARVLPDETPLDKVAGNTPPSIAVSGNRIFVPVRRAVDFIPAVGIVGGIGISIIDTEASYVPSVRLGNTTLVGGGVLKSYDGYQTTEVGWVETPISPTINSTGVGAMGGGTYQYTYHLEFVDIKGNVYRSPIANPVSVTVGGGSSISVRFQYFGLTTRNIKNGYTNKNGRIIIYRTQANGTLFYRLGDGTVNLANEATGSFNVNDNTPDANLGTELLYTTGDTLEDEAPPSSAVINTFKNRVFLVPSEDRTAVWYSKEIQPNEGLAFSSVLQFRVDPIGGDITALSEMDDKIIIFKRRAILYTVGDGANNLGQGGYNQPLLITTEIGAVDDRGVVRTNLGVMFKSDKGIWLLDRGLNLQYIGAPIENYNNRTVTSALSLPAQNQTRFTTSNGEILVYDHVFSEWYPWTGLGSFSSVISDSAYTILKTDRNIWQEDTTLFTDNTAAQTRKMISFPMQLAQIQGYQRVFRITLLGEYRGPHRVRVRLAYNHNEYFEESFEIVPTSSTTWTDTTYQNTTYNAGSVVDNVWQFEIRPSRQTCQSIRLLIEDNFDGLTPGDSFTLSGILLEVGVLGGRFRVPPSTKVMT